MDNQKNFKLNIDAGKAISSSENLNQQLKQMQKELAEMVVQGKEGTKEFEELSQKAGQLKDAIGDAQQHIKRMADDTKGLNDVLDVTKSTISVFGIMQSAVSALGVEDEKLIKTIKTLQTTQTALSSVQQLQNTLMDKSSMTYKLLNASVITYTGTSKAAAIATKALNVALKSIGVGFLLAALAEISAHMDDIKEALSTILPFLKDETKELERQKTLEEERNNKIKERLKLDKDISDAMRKLRIAEGQERDVLQEDVDKAKEHLETLKEQYNVTEHLYDLSKSRVGQEGNLERIQREHGLWSEELKAQDEEYQNILKVVKQQKTEWANAVVELNKAEKALKAYDDQLKKTTEKKPDKTTEKVEKPKVHGASSSAYDEQYREEVEQTNRFLKEKELLLAKGEMSDEDYRKAVLENYDELIRLAEEYGKETIDLEIARQKALNELYESPEAIQAEDITEERQQKIISSLQEGLSATEQLASEIFSAISSGIDNNIKVIEKALNKIDKALDKTEKSIDGHKDNLKGLYAELAESEGANRDALLESIEIERNAMNAQFEEQKRLEAEKAVQEAQLKKEQAKKERMQLANQLVLGIANTAMSITQTAGQLGFPAAIPFIALAGATGAIQTALIASQIGKLKYEKGGLLNGKSHKDGGMRVEGTNIEVEGGEYVVNKKATRRYLPLLEAINGTTKFANGGEINLPSSDNLMNYTNFEFNPVVSVVDINKVNTRLTKVRAR